MFNSKLPFIILIAAAAIQWYVPVSMILHRENILQSGKEYKFKTAPVDPSDPFRGKYITLQYDARMARVEYKYNWQNDEPVYVLLSTDKDGYAVIDKAVKEKPTGTNNFVKAKVDYISYDSLLYINYSFDRYYMEEAKAPDAEKIYRESIRDSSYKTYALVNIKNGEAVLKDVLINGVSIKQITASKK
jgi:uncharacterized membrane-anchored protein